MTATRTWPASPILQQLPSTARLNMTFDAERLVAELTRLPAVPWEQVVVHSASDGADGAGWQSLPLRRLAADAGAAEYVDTEVLKHLPYLAEVLHRLPAPVRGARLMATRPGTRGAVHTDDKCGLPWGTVRLHVPTHTAPGATLDLDGLICVWGTGELWYGDFSRPHAVVNTGATTRVHLVLDSAVTPELLDLFPAAFRTPETTANVLFALPPVPLGDVEKRHLPARCALPASFDDFLGTDNSVLQQPVEPALVRLHEGRPVLAWADGRTIPLVHLGHLTFRFAGWTIERTIEICPVSDRRADVILQIRNGATVTETRLPPISAGLIETPAPCWREGRVEPTIRVVHYP